MRSARTGGRTPGRGGSRAPTRSGSRALAASMGGGGGDKAGAEVEVVDETEEG
jgi:hypothetical protein